MNNGVVRTRLFYRRVMALLDAAAAADANFRIPARDRAYDTAK